MRILGVVVIMPGCQMQQIPASCFLQQSKAPFDSTDYPYHLVPSSPQS
jgi:hypothetical protein